MDMNERAREIVKNFKKLNDLNLGYYVFLNLMNSEI